ncbi:MAG: amino-acid N-acetyltransferase [Patescibacteria group bacterium]
MEDPLAMRNMLRYIPLIHDRILVVKMGGQIIRDKKFINILLDLLLLHTLGVQLVIVHDIDDQTKALLPGANGIGSKPSDVITPEVIDRIKPACATTLVDLLSKLSQINQTVAPINAFSGALVKARHKGVVAGVDQQQLGEVDTVDTEAIMTLLKQRLIPVISPLGTTKQGKLLYLPADEVAAEVAIQMPALKLLYLTKYDGIFARGQKVDQLCLSEAVSLASSNLVSGDMLFKLQQGIKACQFGVPRVHFINCSHDGAVLTELFTRDGIGTMLYNDNYLNIRPAGLDDVSRIMAMTENPVREDRLLRRSVEEVSANIGEYLVYEKDNLVIGCCRLHYWQTEKAAELSHLVVDPEYHRKGTAAQLLEYCENEAKRKEMERIFALTTRTESWFVNRGFRIMDVNALPTEKRTTYNPNRGSKIMGKPLLEEQA